MDSHGTQRKLGLLFFAALTLRLIFLARAGMPEPDEVYYVHAALDILQGDNPGDFMPSVNRGQPVFPLLLSLMFGPWNFLISSRFFSVLIGCFTLIPLYLAARRMAGERVAWWSVILYVLAPFSVQYSLWAMPHAAFNFFWISLLYSILEMLRTRRMTWALAAGLAASGAYLVRVEGAVFFAALFLFILLNGRLPARERLRLAGMMALVFCLVSLPLWIYLHAKTGHWRLTWLSGTSEWERLRQHHLKVHEPGFSLTLLLRRYIKGIWIAVQNCSKILSPAWWFLLAAFLFLKNQFRFAAQSKIAWFFILLPAFFYPVLGTDPRYFHPALIVLLIYCGAGAAAIFDLERPRWAKWLCVALIVLGLARGYRNLWLAQNDDRPGLKAAGEWLRENATGKSFIFGPDTRICFYAEQACGQMLTLQHYRKQIEAGSSLLDILRATKAEWLVHDQYLLKRYHPTIKEICDETVRGDQFEKRYTAGAITLYRIRTWT